MSKRPPPSLWFWLAVPSALSDMPWTAVSVAWTALSTCCDDWYCAFMTSARPALTGTSVASATPTTMSLTPQTKSMGRGAQSLRVHSQAMSVPKPMGTKTLKPMRPNVVMRNFSR